MADASSAYQFTGSPGTPTVTVTGVMPGIIPGDVIVGLSTDGQTALMREVTAVNGLTLTTTSVSLERAFPNANLSFDLSLFNAPEIGGTSDVEGDRSPIFSAVELLKFSHHLEHQFLPGISAVSDFEMDSTFTTSVDLSIFAGVVTNFSSVVQTNFEATSFLNVDFPLQYSQSLTKEFNPIFNKNVLTTVPGLPIPLLVNVKLTPMVGANVDISGATTLQYGYTANCQVNGGFSYDGQDISPISNVSASYDKIGPDYTLSGGVTVGAKASLALTVSFYEATIVLPVVGSFSIDGPGVGVSMGPYANFTATSVYDSTLVPPFKCDQDLRIGFSSHLNVDYGGIGDLIGVADPGPIELFNLSTSLYHDDECIGEDLGNVQGTVADLDGNSLGGVQISAVLSSGEPGASTVSDANGFFLLSDLPTGQYSVEFNAQGYETGFAVAVVTADVTTTLSQILVLDDLDPDAIGTVAVSVVNAQAPTQLVTGATLIFREGLSNPTGPYVAYVQASSGTALVDLPAGYYTVEASAPLFATAHLSLTLPENQTVPLSIVLSSESPPAGGEARIVLTWGQNPSDLDSHLLDGAEHIFYSDPTGSGAQLDVDDVSSYGPETITIFSVDPNETYTYYVHHYSGSGSLATSNAVVKLYYGGTVLTFPVPPGTGLNWHAFDLVDGIVVPCNGSCISSGPPSQGSAAPFAPDSERQTPKPYSMDFEF